jgi:3-oxoadipate enol-lactonase
MFVFTRHNRKLYYEIINPHCSETLVFLNGLTQSTVSWALMTPNFRKYKIVLLDFIFQGKSDKVGEWQNFDEHAADVLSVLNQERIEQSFIAGLSYGSLVAQNFARNYPQVVKKLVLMSSFCHKTPYYEALETSWWQALKLGGYSLLLDVMLPTVLSEGYFQNPLIPIDLMKQARVEANQDAEALFKLMHATRERGDFREELSKLKVQTLVIHGEKDLLFPLHMGQEVARSIPGAQLKVIRNVGHTLNLEGIKETSSEILTFLEH